MVKRFGMIRIGNCMKYPIDFLFKRLRWFFSFQDSELIHEKTIDIIEQLEFNEHFTHFVRSQFEIEFPNLQTNFLNRTLKNPIGLAAGFDKDGRIFNSIYDLGFGYVEIGTVTPRAQHGNLYPRLFRLVEDKAVINRMGFNNLGAKSMNQRLNRYSKKDHLMLGINIGKNKTTPFRQSSDDYVSAMTILYNDADYFTLNISSPNTEDLRKLQSKEYLYQLLNTVCIARDNLSIQHKKKMPLLVKISPDLDDQMLYDSMQVLCQFDIQGVIATNTTIKRPYLLSSNKTENGGLSGTPLNSISTEIIGKLYKIIGSKIPIIGVGGISNGQDAYDKIKAGAVVLQLYTALIYEGPCLVLKIKKELSKLVEQDGFQHISEAVGIDHK